MVFTKTWWKAMAIRAIKTAAQTAAALLPVSAAYLGEVNFNLMWQAAAIAAGASFLTSLGGLPEVE